MIPLLLTAVLAFGPHDSVDSQAPAPPAGASRTAAASSLASEEASVREALNAYLQGHATGRAEHYRRAFHPEAKLFFNRDGRFGQETSDAFIARVATGAPAADEAQRKRRIDFVDITGDTAVARITLDYPSVLFTDYMSLVKVDGEWKIMNKIFHAVRR